MTSFPTPAYGTSDTPGWRDLDLEAVAQVGIVKGRKLGYVDVGPADAERVPLLLIHGIAGSWQNWLQNIPKLSQDRRVIVVDLPGFGGSDGPAGRWTLAAVTDILAALCAQLDVAQVDVLGNSLGGLVAIELALRHQTLVNRLVLIDPAGISTRRIEHGLRIGLGIGLRQSAQGLLLLQRLGGAGDHPLELIVAHPREFERGLLRAAFGPGMGSAGFIPAALHLGELALRKQMLRGIEDLAAPTLIVWGKQDQVLPVSDADALAAKISGAELVLIDDAGHLPMLERPRQFNEIATRFLS